MQTTVTATRDDSGSAVQLAVGDELRLTLPEREATAGWKAEIEGSALVAAGSAASDQGPYWEIGGEADVSTHTFRAVEEGHAVVKMAYQGMGASGVTVLDTFTLEVSVGSAPKPKAERQRLPLPDLALVLVEFFLVGLAGCFVSAVLGLTGARSNKEVEMFIGVLGCVLFGTISIWVMLRFIRMLIVRRLG